MSYMHQPRQLAKELRTIFESPNVPIGFLLGAGCPSSIGLIPDVSGLTSHISKYLSSNDELFPFFRKLRDTLIADGYTQPTVDDFLTRVRRSMDVAGDDMVRGLTAKALKQLENHICHEVSRCVDVPLPSNSPYHSIARLVHRTTKSSTDIFTTNYDLLLEQALESLRVPFFDGFVGSHRPFFDRDAIDNDVLPARWVRLWKLHGSINWRSRNNNVYRLASFSSDNVVDNVLIHPSHLKYVESQRMPYVAMFDRLKKYIHNDNKPIVLFIVGYSFSDEHLNATIADSLQANPHACGYAFQYGKLDDHKHAIACADRTINLNVIARDAAILSNRRGTWSPCDDDEFLRIVFTSPQSTSTDATIATKHPSGNQIAPEPIQCRFCLGDFVQLGRFLDDLAHRNHEHSD